MGVREKYPNPLVIIIASLGFSLILFIIVLVASQKFWSPLMAVTIPTQQPSQTAYPTYTPLPTYTLFFTPEPEWIQSELPYYHIPFKIPDDWNILPINHRFASLSPGDPNPEMQECEDYLIIGPDGKQVIEIHTTCGKAEGIGGGCPEDIQIVESLGGDLLLAKEPDLHDNSYSYLVIDHNSQAWTPPIEYSCVLPPIVEFKYKVADKPFYEIQEFTVAELIIKSLILKQDMTMPK
jgi:hypothetical protein